jgi:UDP:flavonoid glycosyltransferase YjiC (YdhE family)
VAVILLVPHALAGHVEPCVALGQALRDAGHRVSVFVSGQWSARVRQAGLEVSAPTRWRSPAAGAATVAGSVMAARSTASAWQDLVFGSMVDMTSDIQDAARQCAADVVVGDVFMPGAGLAAQRCGLAWASMCCSPIPALDAYKVCFSPTAQAWFEAPETLRELGVSHGPVNLLERVSPQLHLIPTTPRFAGEARLPGSVALVGPLTGPAEVRRHPGRPTVAVTATSVPAWQLGAHADGHERYLRLAIAALSALPVDAEVVLPAGIDAAALGPASPTVSCGGPAPHDELFDRCGAVLTPAGWGTVGRALVRGLPLVLVPIANDQRYIADRCEQLGLGIALDPLTMSEQDLREAIGAVVANASYRAAAEGMAAHFRAARPLPSSASLVAALAPAPSRAGAPL